MTSFSRKRTFPAGGGDMRNPGRLTARAITTGAGCERLLRTATVRRSGLTPGLGSMVHFRVNVSALWSVSEFTSRLSGPRPTPVNGCCRRPLSQVRARLPVEFLPHFFCDAPGRRRLKNGPGEIYGNCCTLVLNHKTRLLFVNGPTAPAGANMSGLVL